MIYYHDTFKVATGKMAEVLDALGNKVIPTVNKAGMELVGAWVARTGESEELIMIFKFENWAQWGKIEEFLSKDEDIKQWAKRRDAGLKVRTTNRFLYPTSFSPLQ